MVFVGVKYHVYLLTFSKTGGEEAGKGERGAKTHNQKHKRFTINAFRFSKIVIYGHKSLLCLCPRCDYVPHN